MSTRGDQPPPGDTGDPDPPDGSETTSKGASIPKSDVGIKPPTVTNTDQSSTSESDAGIKPPTNQ